MCKVHRVLALAAISTVVLGACSSGDDARTNLSEPGAPETPKTRILEAGADVMQAKAPIAALNAYLDGFHFTNGAPQQQMEAHHYCGHLNEELIQCALFDGNDADAKLVGIEYIVSAALFSQLPIEEKRLWHSHAYEVSSGQLIAPAIPAIAEHELMEKLAGTYGKTWHTWHTDLVTGVPLGVPMLMMGFTADGQADSQKVLERDRRFEVSSAEKREQRRNIRTPPPDTAADAWTHGIVVQVQAVQR